MGYRIVIPCREDRPEQRHRWLEREHYLGGFTDKWCTRCGRWFVDVIEHPPTRDTQVAEPPMKMMP